VIGSPSPRVDPAAAVEIRLIGAPEAAEEAAGRLPALFAFQRWSGPHPSRKTPGQVRYYLTGRLRQAADGSALAGQVDRLERKCARLRAALELLTCCEHGLGLDCPDCEPVPDLVRQALENQAVRRP
jgi:hypothetical protein